MDSFGPKNPQKSRTEYCCEKCNYNTVRKSVYDKHLLTAKHKMDSFGPKNPQKSCTEYCCEKCNYNTVRKNDYAAHLLTAKHKVAHISSNEHKCDNCSKIYQTSSGLRKHKKICVPIIPSKDELIMTLINQNAELHEKMIELCKNGSVNTTINNNTNSHNNNKTFNLQFFLNETCKDAMNISDFVNSVVLKLQDIENIGEVGYPDGVSKMVITQFNSLGETKRPIHCTDLKRDIIYVKDNDKWEKDTNKDKMRLLIKKIDKKLVPLMIEFTNNHNKEYRTDTEIIKHQKVIYEVFGGAKEESENEDSIIRAISKKITINKSLS